jgi:hypothetical protein
MLNQVLDQIKRLIRSTIHAELDNLRGEVETLKLLMGKSMANGIKTLGVIEDIRDVEFKVFSQFGDDGIIQYLVNQLEPLSHTFIEFGVQDYTEANTRFLLLNDNWKGLIMDGSQDAMNSVRAQDLYWRYDLTAVGAFVDKDNINNLFTENGFRDEIGLLVIDIDGNDYWIWKEVDVVNPVIVSIEYNSVFGPDHAVTIPYNSKFSRTDAHYSNLYWGASLKALCMLAEKKGYAFTGSNSNGNNAYFVRKDKLGSIRPITCREGYVESKFRESRDVRGDFTYLHGPQRLQAIGEMEIYDLEKQTMRKIMDLPVKA